MTKLLDSDWLRAVQLKSNTSAKSVKGWTHDEIVAGSVAEVEWKSTPETLQATLRATVSEATIWCNYPIARNVACNVTSCGRAFIPVQKA